MGFNVQERAECVGTYRWIEIHMMRTLARWIPTTPEMEVKVLFGRHLWDCAQHADALGKRAFELRAPLNYTLPAVDAYRGMLAELDSLEATADRVDGFYSCARPALIDAYRNYMRQTDPLMDDPTIRIIENAVGNYTRMDADRDRLLGKCTIAPGQLSTAEWRSRVEALRTLVDHGSDNNRARGVQA